MANPIGQVNSRVSTDLKFRSQPNTNSEIMAELSRGTRFEIIRQVTGHSYPPGTRNDWYEIEFNSQRGYVAAYFVDVIDNGNGNAQRIVDAVNQVDANRRYYQARDITGDRIPETFCNWFAADVLDLLGVPINRYGASAGSYPTPHPIYGNNPPRKPWSAEDLFDFFSRGGAGKWQQVDKANAVANAKNGKVVVASCPPRSSRGSGHIAIVLPRGSASDIRIAQAGVTNSNDMSFNVGFSGSNAGRARFFTYVG